jgi:PKD repeat protein
VTFLATYQDAHSWQLDFGDLSVAAIGSRPGTGPGTITVTHTYTVIGNYQASIVLNGLAFTKQTVSVQAN